MLEREKDVKVSTTAFSECLGSTCSEPSIRQLLLWVAVQVSSSKWLNPRARQPPLKTRSGCPRSRSGPMPPLVMLPAVPQATTLGMAAGQVPVQGVALAQQEASGLLQGAAGSLL